MRALAIHPSFGSMWLNDAKVDGDHVVGTIVADTLFGHDIPETVNIPVSFIRKWES